MQLRFGRLSPDGRPLDSRSRLVSSWEQRSSTGELNCDVPAELQAVRLTRHQALIAWSSACDLRGGTGGPASITGVVVDDAGRIVRTPFRILGYDRGLTAESRPLFWLRSTVAGNALLVWEAPSRVTSYHRALFVSRLNAGLQAERAIEIFSEDFFRGGGITV